jgi:hypothetical protein
LKERGSVEIKEIKPKVCRFWEWRKVEERVVFKLYKVPD